MAKARVFISHSAREDKHTLTLLEALNDRLRAEGFEVLLDRKSLEVGDAWEHKIGTWLDSCHAAVLLLTTKALASSYVKFEVSNLLHRWDRCAGKFLVLPVLVESLADAQLNEFYGAIKAWGMIQRLGPDDDGVIIEALIDKLKGLDVAGLSDDMNERLKGHIAAILREVKDDNYLADVAERIGADTTNWPATDVAPLLADALVFSSITARWDAVRFLHPRFLRPGLIRSLFDYLMPCWVGPEAARALDGVTLAKPGTRCAIVNARAVTFTPGMYLARAKSQRHLAGDIVELATDALGTDVERELMARVRMLLEKKLLFDDLFYPQTLPDMMRKRADDPPLIVAMRVDARVAEAIPAVAATEDLQKATFLALMEPAPAEEDVPRMTVLHPLLPNALEGTAYTLHKEYERQLNQLDGTPRKT